MTLPRSAAVLGLGAVGSALAHELPRAGIPVSLAWQRGQGTPPAKVRDAPLVLLAVPDGAVEALCRQLVGLGLVGKGQLVVHLAGALPLLVLEDARRAGAEVGSLHPLRAFVRGGPRRFAGAACGVSGGSKGAVLALREVAVGLGMDPIDAPDATRALYHAGAVLSAGCEVALFAAATRAFSLATSATEAEARAALLPLALNSLEHLKERTPAEVLTGPIARGDAATVKAHRAALPKELLPLYDALSRVALSLARAGDRSTPAALDAVEKILSASRGRPAPRSGSSPRRPPTPAPATRAASSPRSKRSGSPPAPPPPGRATRRRK